MTLIRSARLKEGHARSQPSKTKPLKRTTEPRLNLFNSTIYTIACK
jgi:hypothetical protein